MSPIAAAQFNLFPRITLAAGLAATAVAALAAFPARAEDISLNVDRAKVVHMARPADVVIVGNPAIADATVQDNQTLIITGKSFGSTNLIVLDSTGQSISDDTVTVTQPDDGVVTVYRRAERQTYSCTPACSPTLSIGDNDSSFSAVNSQIQSHADTSGGGGKQ